jgi:hypothetical protein
MGNRKPVSAIGEALYGQTRQAVLSLFFGQPDSGDAIGFLGSVPPK